MMTPRRFSHARGSEKLCLRGYSQAIIGLSHVIWLTLKMED